jgi:hypothetical protein
MCVNNPSFLVIQTQWIENWFLMDHVAKDHNAKPNNHVVVHGILCANMCVCGGGGGWPKIMAGVQNGGCHCQRP